MILRSPAENENGGISFHMVPSSTRHSRARGNPGLLRRISLDTRFRGYDGTQAGLLVLIPKRVFSKEVTKSTKLRTLEISMSETFVAGACPEFNRRVCFVVRYCLAGREEWRVKIVAQAVTTSRHSCTKGWTFSPAWAKEALELNRSQGGEQ